MLFNPAVWILEFCSRPAHLLQEAFSYGYEWGDAGPPKALSNSLTGR